ncbi:hypothetical protein LCGC14_2616520 [marine sediment metagenome]|uniref:30S ribosomal protein S6 n=1 Tax=marine sediment metagenome TaxID=412755 RepID=A0A0F9CFE9_9ZZZZ
MDTVIKRLYEGLFLVDSGEAASDWDGVMGSIEKMLERGDADVVSIKKWDERRLAYEVNGKERGTYILTYFNGDPAKITGIERDVQLSERITRVMILRTDIMEQEDIDKDTPVEKVEKHAAAEAEAAIATSPDSLEVSKFLVKKTWVRSCRGVWLSPPPCQGGDREFKSHQDRHETYSGVA